MDRVGRSGFALATAIVQDIGLVRLMQQVYPGFEIHGSVQMTVHDASGARVMEEIGIDRVVLAREITLGDIRAAILQQEQTVWVRLSGTVSEHEGNPAPTQQKARSGPQFPSGIRQFPAVDLI